MVIDSSALIAIMSKEPERRHFEQSIRLASTRLLSAPGLVETSMVVPSRRGRGARCPERIAGRHADRNRAALGRSCSARHRGLPALRQRASPGRPQLWRFASPTRLPKRPAPPCCSRAMTFRRPTSSEPSDHARPRKLIEVLNCPGFVKRLNSGGKGYDEARERCRIHSHSIVPGGFDVMS